MENAVVIGSNYGDESKGRTTDYLVKQMLNQKLNPIVVRFSGSNNASHTVYLNETTYHAFSSIGSGSFRNVPTYLSEFFAVEPQALINELDSFKLKFNYTSTIFIDPNCLLVTPYDVALNRLKETLKGNHKHGSTGSGLNECKQRSKTLPFYVKDLLTVQNTELFNNIYAYFIKQLQYLIDQYKLDIETLDSDLKDLLYITLNMKFIDAFYSHYSSLLDNPHITLETPDLKEYSCVFEGSQGLALEEDYHNFPYVTHSKTGIRNVLEICVKHGIELTDVYYLSRTYLSRHGFDPNFNTCHHKNVLEDFNIFDVTNVYNPWQGSMVFNYLNINELESRINDDFKHCLEAFPNCLEHRVFSCVDQIKGKYKVVIDNTLHIFPSFNDFLNLYMEQFKISFVTSFTSPINN